MGREWGSERNVESSRKEVGRGGRDRVGEGGRDGWR